MNGRCTVSLRWLITPRWAHLGRVRAPLGLGGHLTSANNLWLQNWSEAAMKGREELRLHREVCAGRMTLEQAQHDMLATWGPR